jgi:hypothetical protein
MDGNIHDDKEKRPLLQRRRIRRANSAPDYVDCEP